MNNRILYVTLAVAAAITFAFTLILYAWLTRSSSVSPRLGYAVFVSLLPALGALVVLKLTRLSIPWRGTVLSIKSTAALIYFLLFLLLFISTFKGLIRASLSLIKMQ